MLRELFASVLYWDSDPKRLVDVECPSRGGVYFFKNQSCVQDIEVSLREYERAHKMIKVSI